MQVASANALRSRRARLKAIVTRASANIEMAVAAELSDAEDIGRRAAAAELSVNETARRKACSVVGCSLSRCPPREAPTATRVEGGLATLCPFLTVVS
jgi:hypothetical protein